MYDVMKTTEFGVPEFELLALATKGSVMSVVVIKALIQSCALRGHLMVGSVGIVFHVLDVSGVVSRITSTARVWPIRCTRSIACADYLQSFAERFRRGSVEMTY